MYRTPSARPISRVPSVLPSYCCDEVREVTRRALMRARSVMISSVRPSLKYSFSASVLMFTNGSTAMAFSATAARG